MANDSYDEYNGGERSKNKPRQQKFRPAKSLPQSSNQHTYAYNQRMQHTPTQQSQMQHSPIQHVPTQNDITQHKSMLSPLMEVDIPQPETQLDHMEPSVPPTSGSFIPHSSHTEEYTKMQPMTTPLSSLYDERTEPGTTLGGNQVGGHRELDLSQPSNPARAAQRPGSPLNLAATRPRSSPNIWEMNRFPSTNYRSPTFPFYSPPGGSQEPLHSSRYLYTLPDRQPVHSHYHTRSEASHIDPFGSQAFTTQRGGGGSSNSSGITKGHSKRPHTRSHRRSKSSRNIDSFDSGNISMALIAPTFVPGMPMSGSTSGPQVAERPPGGIYWALMSRPVDAEGTYNPESYDQFSLDENGEPITLPIQMCQPPLHNIVPAYPQALDADPQPRTRKQSKYTAEQDHQILELKNKGKSWAEIAKLAGCHNQLAARNRYQVLIGQQGGGTFFWTTEDCAALQECLDEGERAKLIFIAQELSRKLEQHFSIDMVHYKICSLFAECPERFGVVRNKDPSRGGAPFKRALLCPSKESD